MAKKKRRKRRQELTGRITFLAMLVIVCVLGAAVLWKSRDLRAKDAEYAAREQRLTEQVADEESRTDELEEKKIYVQSKEYIEKIAKEKLSLVYPDEILFKSDGD